MPSNLYKAAGFAFGAACIVLAVCSGFGLISLPFMGMIASGLGVSEAVAAPVGWGALGTSSIVEGQTGSMDTFANRVIYGDKNNNKNPALSK